MQAVILAAGRGTRMRELTENRPKCLLKIHGRTFLEKAIDALEAYGIERLTIVTGYLDQMIREHVSAKMPVTFIHNAEYEKRNNIFSVFLARDRFCADDTLLLESDLIFDPALLGLLLENSGEAVGLVDVCEPWMDGTCVKIDEGRLRFTSTREERAAGMLKTVNIWKFSRRFSRDCYFPFLDAYRNAFGDGAYYEDVLRCVAAADPKLITVVSAEGFRWHEADTPEDFRAAALKFQQKSLHINVFSDMYRA